MLRKAKTKDIPRIAEIIIFTKRTTYRPIFKNDNVSFNEMLVGIEITRLEQKNALDNLYVYDDGVIKAIVSIIEETDKIKISEFFVDPFFQGEGIGTKIIEHIITLGRDLYLYVLDKNIKAIKFYKKHGFVYSGESEEFENSGFYILKYVRTNN